MSSQPGAGDPAPDFALPDHDGTIHRLSDQRGRWTVVYFYPEDDTPGCTVEACAFRDVSHDLAAAGATAWGISPDGAASHGRFRAKFHLDFPLLSDEDHAAAESYGAWVEKTKAGRTFMGIQRSTFLVGPDGRIAHAWPTVRPEGHAEEVLAALAAARRGPGALETPPVGGDRRGLDNR
jgi:peroxiredoxin Q/BCP